MTNKETNKEPNYRCFLKRDIKIGIKTQDLEKLQQQMR